MLLLDPRRSDQPRSRVVSSSEASSPTRLGGHGRADKALLHDSPRHPPMSHRALMVRVAGGPALPLQAANRTAECQPPPPANQAARSIAECGSPGCATGGGFVAVPVTLVGARPMRTTTQSPSRSLAIQLAPGSAARLHSTSAIASSRVITPGYPRLDVRSTRHSALGSKQRDGSHSRRGVRPVAKPNSRAGESRERERVALGRRA
jgi:hypothetical protein